MDAANVKSWKQETGRTVHVIVKRGEEVIYSAESKSSEPAPAANKTEETRVYEHLTTDKKWWQFWK